MNYFLLDFLALGAIISGILVITSKNPVISVLFLISVFVNVAGYLVLLGVGFIGISYVVVYVGAVTVLFLFVIMIINIELSELNAAGSEYTQNVPLTFILGSTFFYEILSVLPTSHLSENEGFADNITNVILGFINSLNFTMLNKIDLQSANINFSMTFNSIIPDTMFNPTTIAGGGLQVQSIGTMVYTHSAVWLMIASIILLLAMVGPITLSMNKNN